MPYAFFEAVEDAIRETLGRGPHGWPVPDCAVTKTHSGYGFRGRRRASWPRRCAGRAHGCTRTDRNPLNRKECLLNVTRRTAGRSD